MTDPLLVTDADNTLWDTNAVFAAAQLELLDLLEDRTGLRLNGGNRLSFVRKVDQEIALGHPDRLRYPPLLLVAGLVRALRVADNDWGVHPRGLACRVDSVEIGDWYSRRLRDSMPELRDGVPEALARLRKMGIATLVATEGSEQRCRAVLTNYGLTLDVVSAPKTPELYQLIGDRFGTAKRLMVGDQLDRDIAFAKQARFETVWFPGGFAPSWLEGIHVGPDHTIDSFRDLPGIAEQLRLRPPMNSAA